MKKEHFSILINAPREKVWSALWDDNSYREWTSVFSEGSSAISDWNEGSSIQFLSKEGDGMHSIIERKVENELMTFKHMGEMKNFKEQKKGETAHSWEGAKESYKLVDKGDQTDLQVEIDVTEEYQEYFQNTFPKALEKIKQLAESN